MSEFVHIEIVDVKVIDDNKIEATCLHLKGDHAGEVSVIEMNRAGALALLAGSEAVTHQ